MRVGVDTGGTFTDVVADDGRIAKVPSTPHDPGEAVRRGVDALPEPAGDAGGAAAAGPAGSGGRPQVLAHGTTVAPTRCWSGVALAWPW